MKKFLLSIVATLFAIGMNAQTEVVFDFDNNATDLFGIDGRSSGSDTTAVNDGDILEVVTATVDGVSLTVSPADEGKTANRLWTSSPVLRMYSGTLTIAAPGHKITKIQFSQGKWAAANAFDSGEFTNNAWSGDANSVVLTVAANTQLKKITVTLDGQSGEEPEPVVLAGTGEGTVESPYDVARALSLIEKDMVSNDNVYVAGTVTTVEDLNVTYGNATYLLGQGELSLKVYRGYSLGNQKFVTEDDLQEGDEVVVYGKLVTNYGGQITTGSSLYSLNGKTYTPPTEIPGTGEGTLESPFSVARALYYCTLSSTETYYVAGTISSLSEEYANNFNISDDGTTEGELQFYNGVGLEGSTIEMGDLAVGDKVIVFGKLKVYGGTAELDKGCQIYSLNGETKKPEVPYEMVGDGTQENPYTVDDVKYLNTLEAGEDPVYVWVKGYILGSAASAAKLHEVEKRVDTNIAIAASADDTKFVPVALLAVDVRNQLGVASNPEHIGKEVVVYGTLEKYFSTAGVKNVSDYILEGVRYEPDGIEGVAADKANAAAYDLSGRRVNNAAKGLLIVGGKKVVK